MYAIRSYYDGTRDFKRPALQNLVFAYLVTQALLLFLVRVSRREWQLQLTEQTSYNFV